MPRYYDINLENFLYLKTYEALAQMWGKHVSVYSTNKETREEHVVNDFSSSSMQTQATQLSIIEQILHEYYAETTEKEDIEMGCKE